MAIQAAAISLLLASLAAVLVLWLVQDFDGRLSIDALTALRWQIFGPIRDPPETPVFVVAIDEETFRTPPFQGTPSIAWTREVGRVLTAIVNGGAKVVGFDVVYPVSIEQSVLPFVDETLGARLRGFDRDFLRALALAARDGKVVLGEVQHREQPILPSPGQRAAVGGQRNIRPLNVYTDSDEVVRRMPLSFLVDGTPTPSMAVELAARALGSTPQFLSDGSMVLAGRRVAGIVPNTITLNFAGVGDIPTFSFADLATCAAGDQDSFRRQFRDKVVLIGTLLDVEDRKVTSKRFATAPERIQGARCVRPALPVTQESAVATGTIAGVYVQATAINNLVRHNALTEIGRANTILIAIAFFALAALAALAFAPLVAAASYAAGALLWSTIATVAFENAVVLPLVEPLIAGFCALAATVGYRLVILPTLPLASSGSRSPLPKGALRG